MKKIVILCTICCIGFIAGIYFIWFEIDGTITNNDINVYKQMTLSDKTAPDIDDFGKYSNIDFKFFRKHMLFFRSDSYTLISSYNKDTYLKEKEEFKSSYAFYNEPICNDPDLSLNVYKLKPHFSIDGYEFSVISSVDADFPHDIYFWGFNDNENKIAFIYYHNFDLDYIESFEEHIRDECGWRK